VHSQQGALAESVPCRFVAAVTINCITYDGKFATHRSSNKQFANSDSSMSFRGSALGSKRRFAIFFRRDHVSAASGKWDGRFDMVAHGKTAHGCLDRHDAGTTFKTFRFKNQCNTAMPIDNNKMQTCDPQH
jgi:hypothetical protein